MKPVGFIGLGQIGAPMARRLLDWPGGLVVHDIRPEAVAPFAKRGAQVAPTPGQVAAAADLISVMVLNDAQAEQVLIGPDGILSAAAPGTIVAVHSTISDTTAIRLGEVAAAQGVQVVDAAVSGGPMGAAEGRLAVMVGASDEAFARCQQVFASWAALVVHAGPPGAGIRAKLARNLLHFVAFTAAGEAARLAEAAGLDLVELGKVVRHTDAITGGPGAIMHRDSAAPVDPSDGWYAILTHVRDLGTKDLSLALDLGERLGVDLPLARLARERFANSLGLEEENPA